MDINLVNKCVVLHALLEEAGELLDLLKGTNVYRQEVKRGANILASALESQIKTWYEYHLTNEPKQVMYLQVRKDLELALKSVLKTPAHNFKIVPAFLEALKEGNVEIKNDYDKSTI